MARQGRRSGKVQVKVAPGTRYLLITCAAPAEGQFRGVARAARLLSRSAGVCHLVWHGQVSVDLASRRALRWVAVSGHGADDAARVCGGAGALRPGDLRLPAGVPLYLLACSQGREPRLAEWAACGAAPRGCAGETESALSALFVLALVEHGPESAAAWFERWREANDRLRPRFAEMRRLYKAAGSDWVEALAAIADAVDLGGFADILAVAGGHETVLDGLGRRGRGSAGGRRASAPSGAG
jgi:hypothetical protein